MLVSTGGLTVPTTTVLLLDDAGLFVPVTTRLLPNVALLDQSCAPDHVRLPPIVPDKVGEPANTMAPVPVVPEARIEQFVWLTTCPSDVRQ